jgi:probable rRNA maturation factor
MASKRSQVAIQYAVSRRGVPSAASFRRWVDAATKKEAGSICIRIVGSAESRELNRQWRQKDKPTNVLSFPYSLPKAQGLASNASPLGDLVICAPVVAREAREQGKALSAHWAHMVIHGTLHLQGYDHVNNRDAKKMEAREVEILARFGYQDPYVF